MLRQTPVLVLEKDGIGDPDPDPGGHPGKQVLIGRTHIPEPIRSGELDTIRMEGESGFHHPLLESGLVIRIDHEVDHGIHHELESGPDQVQAVSDILGHRRNASPGDEIKEKAEIVGRSSARDTPSGNAKGRR
jgi:hypothetical protein